MPTASGTATRTGRSIETFAEATDGARDFLGHYFSHYYSVPGPLVAEPTRWRCQAYGLWGALEVHHVVKRAQGGSDFDLDRLVALCPPCHAQTDAPAAG